MSIVKKSKFLLTFIMKLERPTFSISDSNSITSVFLKLVSDRNLKFVMYFIEVIKVVMFEQVLT